MRFNFKKIKKMSVETASGFKLGHVSDIMLDTEGQTVSQYTVKKYSLLGKEYLISRDQIVRFEDKKIIVEDATVKNKNSKKEKSVTVNPEAVSMRESN